MRVDEKSQTDRIGISIVQLQFSKLGWTFREQPVSDYGIDAFVEIIEENNATGKLIALQIKSGESWFREKTEKGFTFRGDGQHLTYWKEYSIPVIIVLCNTKTHECYWESINDDSVINTAKGWKITIPFNQSINENSQRTLKRLTGEIAVYAKYTIISLRDSSHARAKRYVANILLNKEFTKAVIVQVIKQCTEEIKAREYYRTEQLKILWSGKKADVVWLFVYPSMEDVRTTNWICHTQWINPTLNFNARPLSLSGESIEKNIIVDWNKDYQFYSKFYQERTLPKEKYLEQIFFIVKPTQELVQSAIKLTNKYKTKVISEQDYIKQMKILKNPLSELYLRSGDIGLAPTECFELEKSFLSLMNFSHNFAIYFSDRGATMWTGNNRDFLIQTTIEDYTKELIRFSFELEKIH